MNVRRIAALAVLLLLCAVSALAEDEPAFLSQYEDYYRINNGWYAVCLDPLPAGVSEEDKRPSTVEDDSGIYVVYDAWSNEPDVNWGLTDGEGNLLLDGLRFWYSPERECNQVPFEGFYAGGRLAPVRIGSAFGYVDRDGNLAIDPIYARADRFYSGAARVAVQAEDGTLRWGMIDETGAALLEPAYLELQGYSPYIGARASTGWAFCNLDLDVMTDAVYEDISILWEAGAVPVKRDGRWGYIRVDGTVMIEPAYAEAGVFRDGRAVVRGGDASGWGLIDETGAYVIEPEYLSIDYMDFDHIEVETREGFGVMNGDGASIVDCVWQDIEYDYVYAEQGEPEYRVEKDNLFGYLNADGSVAVEPTYTAARPFMDGTAVVSVGEGSFGLIDAAGAQLIEPVYQDIERAWGDVSSSWSTAVYLVQSEGLWGFVDSAYRQTAPCVYREIDRFSVGGMRRVQDGAPPYLYGYLDAEGSVLIEPCYYAAEEFDSVDAGKWAAWVRPYSESGYGLIDTAGSYLIGPVYDEPGYSVDGYTVAIKDGKYGLFNPDYVMIAECDYDYISLYSEPFKTELGGLYGLMDREGRVLFEPKFEQIGRVSDNGLIPVELDGRWGYADLQGNMVIPATFKYANPFSDGLACVGVEAAGYLRLDGCIDETGAWVIEPGRFSWISDFKPCGYAAAGLADSDEYAVIDREGNVLLTNAPFDYGFSGDQDGIDISDDGIVTLFANGPGEDEVIETCYDLSSGEAVPVTVMTASLDLTDYKPFTGAKVATLDGEASLDFSGVGREALPRLDGATALVPVYAAFAQAVYPDDTRYEDYHSGGDPVFTCTKTATAYERLIDGEADVIFVAQPSDEELRMAAERGVEFDMAPLGAEAFVFVVNRQNPCQGLTLDQIRSIYSGQTTEWDEVGVPGLGSILAYQRPENSGSQTALEALMGDVPLMEAPQEVIAEDMGDILKTVEYRNLPNALGYTFRFFCTDMMQSEVSLLSIDGVTPTPEHIRSGEYPLTSTLYAISLKGNANPNVAALLEWIRSDQGMELIEKSGYVSNATLRAAD